MADPDEVEAAQAEVELLLLQGLVQSVAAKTDRVCGDLAAIRQHLQAVVCLSDNVLAELQPPNPLHADATRIREQAAALLRLPGLALLDL